jgi:hypothetical protein
VLAAQHQARRTGRQGPDTSPQERPSRAETKEEDEDRAVLERKFFISFRSKITPAAATRIALIKIDRLAHLLWPMHATAFERAGKLLRTEAHILRKV